MPIELCQMLVTARVMKGELPKETKYYTPRMRNHPCSIWVRSDRAGFAYTERLLHELCDEYYHRFGQYKEKHHKTGLFWKALPSTDLDVLFPRRRRAKPVPLAVKHFPKFDCPVKTYRNYYLSDKLDFANWTNRPIPDWFFEGLCA